VVYQAAKALDVHQGAVLRFNFRGTGLSEGKHDKGIGERDDVRAALDFLAHGFSGKPLVLAGFSFGCWVGLRVGCGDSRVQRLIGIGGPVNSSDFWYLETCSKRKLFVQGGKDEFGEVGKLRELVATLRGRRSWLLWMELITFSKEEWKSWGRRLGIG